MLFRTDQIHQSLRIWAPITSPRAGVYPGVVSVLVEEEKTILGRVYFRKAHQISQQKMRTSER